MTDGEAFTMETCQRNLTCVMVGTIVEGDGECDVGSVLVEHGNGVHAARKDKCRVFHKKTK